MFLPTSPLSRRTLTSSLALGGVAALTACGRSESSGEPASPQQVTALSDSPATGPVTVWAQGTEGEALPELLEEFAAENPDADVQVTAVPWDSAQSKYQTAVAGGNTPDIGMLGTDWMPSFADALAVAPQGIDTSGMFPEAVGSTRVGDAVLGVPWYVETRVLFYRTDLVREAGFQEFPTDYAGLFDLAAALQSRGAEHGIDLPAGGWNAFLGGLPFMWSNGAEVLDADGSAWTFDTEEMLTGITYLKSFFDAGICSTNPDATVEPAADLASGRVPIILNGPWSVSQVLEAGGPGFEDEFALATMPIARSGTSLISGANLVVFRDSGHQEAAWKLIRWLARPQVQQRFFELTGDLPAQKEAWNAPSLADDARVAVFGRQLQDVRPLPAAVTWPEVSAAADTVVEQIYRGGLDPAAGLAQLQAQADAIGTGR